MRIKRLICAALLGVSFSACAADWMVVAKNDQAVTLIDKASLKQKGSLRRVWVKIEWPTPGAEVDNGKVISYELAHWIFNCGAETTALGEYSMYDTRGLQAQSGKGEPNRFDEIRPGSLGDILAKSVCVG